MLFQELSRNRGFQLSVTSELIRISLVNLNAYNPMKEEHSFRHRQIIVGLSLPPWALDHADAEAVVETEYRT